MAIPIMVPTMVVMPVMMVPMAMIAPTITPVGIPTPIVTIVVRITPIPVPTPIAAPIGTIAPSVIIGRVVVPIEGIVTIHVDVRVTTATAVGIIVVIIVSRRGGLCAETLDACGKVRIVVGLCGGVNHAIGVGHRFSGLVNGFGIADVVLAVGIVGLVVVFRVAADAWAHIGTVACRHAALVAVRRIVGVVVGGLPA